MRTTSFASSRPASVFPTASPAFGFDHTWTCTDLANPVWVPVSTNVLASDGTSPFTDPQSGNYPARYYRIRVP